MPRMKTESLRVSPKAYERLVLMQRLTGLSRTYLLETAIKELDLPCVMAKYLRAPRTRTTS